MRNKIKVGIAGGAGYTGGELIRLLLQHPEVSISQVLSKSNAGNYLYQVHADLLGDTDMKFSEKPGKDMDVIFLCLGHGESKKFLDENQIPDSVKIIDLSQDFRLKSGPAHDFVYGLPELNREEIRKARKVANPGCFATAIQLGLLPLAKNGLLDEIYTTGITGSTGAGQGFSVTSHFSWRANNIQAYKTLSHQHIGEIGQSLLQLQSHKDIHLNFVPWRGDFTRGIFISSLIHCELPAKTLHEIFTDFYQDHPFTILAKEPIFLKQAVNTNKCIIQLEKVGSKLVVHSILDNLLKGASGQALQNMNLMCGLEECAGLRLKAGYF